MPRCVSFVVNLAEHVGIEPTHPLLNDSLANCCLDRSANAPLFGTWCQTRTDIVLRVKEMHNLSAQPGIKFVDILLITLYSACQGELVAGPGIEPGTGAYETPVLPLHYPAILLVGVTRFEHATTASQTQSSTKLSYTPIILFSLLYFCILCTLGVLGQHLTDD